MKQGQSSADREWCTEGGKIIKAIGFDDSPHQHRRAERACQTFANQTDEKDKYELRFSPQEWGWPREKCVQAIQRAGLPVPPKSNCYFCPAMKPHEVARLGEWELKIIIIMDARRRQRHSDHAESKGWPRGVGIPLCEGLWGRAVNGCRGAILRPGSMTKYIKDQGLLRSMKWTVSLPPLQRNRSPRLILSA